MSKHDPNRLGPSGDGRYCKRIRGTLHHFGRRGPDGPDAYAAALAEFLAVKDQLKAGKKPRPVSVRRSTVTLKLVADSFLSAMTRRVDGEGKPMKGATFDDYARALAEFTVAAGESRDPGDLRPDDFAAVRRDWSSRLGPWALDRNVQAVRTMFRWAVTHRLVDRPPFYGDAFGKSTEADKRRSARETSRERGERAFLPDEVAAILAAATGSLRAMVLLALNGGMYAADVARVRLGDVKKHGNEWLLDFERGKTGAVPWKFPLWPETKAAIDAVAARRRTARRPGDADLLFLTVNGRPWQNENVHRAGAEIRKVSETHGIGQEFDKILDNLWLLDDAAAWKWRPLKRRGLGFGTLRHTFISAIGDHADIHARHLVTGHKAIGIQAKHYDKPSFLRLKVITDLARSRLLSM